MEREETVGWKWNCSHKSSPMAISAHAVMHKMLQKSHQSHNIFSLKLRQNVPTYETQCNGQLMVAVLLLLNPFFPPSLGQPRLDLQGILKSQCHPRSWGGACCWEVGMWPKQRERLAVFWEPWDRALLLRVSGSESRRSGTALAIFLPWGKFWHGWQSCSWLVPVVTRGSSLSVAACFLLHLQAFA